MRIAQDCDATGSADILHLKERLPQALESPHRIHPHPPSTPLPRSFSKRPYAAGILEGVHGNPVKPLVANVVTDIGPFFLSSLSCVVELPLQRSRSCPRYKSSKASLDTLNSLLLSPNHQLATKKKTNEKGFRTLSARIGRSLGKPKAPSPPWRSRRCAPPVGRPLATPRSEPASHFPLAAKCHHSPPETKPNQPALRHPDQPFKQTKPIIQTNQPTCKPTCKSSNQQPS